MLFNQYKMKTFVFIQAVMLWAFLSPFLCAQDVDGPVGEKRKSNFHVGVDIQTKYVWRGMEMMPSDSAPVLFPQINYKNKGFYAYLMGATAINGMYSEVDMGVSYTYKWLTIGISDYYYPTLHSPRDRYFHFNGSETGHWLEGIITIAPEKIPVHLTISTFFYGADKDADSKQAYSTYAELGGYYGFLNDHQLSLTVGACFNRSCYNGYAGKFGVCNIDFRYTYNLSVKDYTWPLSVAYIVNPFYEKAHINFMASFVF